jgi:hypothetical protein
MFRARCQNPPCTNMYVRIVHAEAGDERSTTSKPSHRHMSSLLKRTFCRKKIATLIAITHCTAGVSRGASCSSWREYAMRNLLDLRCATGGDRPGATDCRRPTADDRCSATSQGI